MVQFQKLTRNLFLTLHGQINKAQRGRRGITIVSLTSALDGGGWSTPLPGHFTPEMTRWERRVVWKDAENFESGGIRSPERPGRCTYLKPLAMSLACMLLSYPQSIRTTGIN
jgi:hypothetical protein